MCALIKDAYQLCRYTHQPGYTTAVLLSVDFICVNTDTQVITGPLVRFTLVKHLPVLC
jgi:hypothetical protein